MNKYEKLIKAQWKTKEELYEIIKHELEKQGIEIEETKK